MIIDPDIITEPRHWDLIMRLEPSRLEVVMFAPIRGGSLLYGTTLLEGESMEQSFETAVYDNPVLLTDGFNSVHLLIAGTPAMLVPPGCGRGDMLAVWDAQFGTAQSSAVLDVVESPLADAVMLAGVDSKLSSFVKRTFIKAEMHSTLDGLCRYFVGLSARGNGRKLFINFNEAGVDVVATDRNHLLFANSFKCDKPDDACYYALCCRDMLALTNPSDTVMISGDSSLREPTVAMLRRFVSNVIPVIFPTSMLMSGSDVRKASFDLIVFPLRKQCE